MKPWLLNVCVWTALVLITLFFVFLAPLLLFCAGVLARIPWPRLARWCIWGYGFAVARMLGLFFPLRIERDQAKSRQTPRIFVYNHASFLDLFLTTQAAPPDSVCLARQWPFSVPLFGPVMRLGGYVNTEKLSGEEVMQRSKELLTQGVSLAIFPEGTRSRTGELGRYKTGAFKLSVETGVPICPVVIQGTGGILPPKSFAMQPGNISIRVLDDLDPASYSGDALGHRAMCRHTQQGVSAALRTPLATF